MNSKPWIIDEKKTWPPRDRPSSPFGVTQIDIIHSCPLRACFDASSKQGYEPRFDVAARVGLAFHATMESLITSPISQTLSPSDAAADARERFRQQWIQQEVERKQRPREKWLPANQTRVDRAVEAIMREARRMSEDGFFSNTHSTYRNAVPNDQKLTGKPGDVSMEVPVKSKDGLLKGRIDRIEWTNQGVRILDYKSALRDDLPERYEQQLQLYAWIWHEMTSEWPHEALVIYPFTSKSYIVNVQPSTCETTVHDARTTVEHLMKARVPTGKPGTVCQICQYRPWCKTFWQWQASENSYRESLNQAYYGFEGKIISLELKDHHWRVNVQWRNATIQIVAAEERFPQLKEARVGDWVRAMEMRLKGQMFQPRAIVSEYSELFIVRGV